MQTQPSSVKPLNRLLRGELSAIETYEQALQKFMGPTIKEDLNMIIADHREAANTLRRHIIEKGGDPDNSSGAWGTWAKAVEGTAKVFGESASLKALKEGEEHGVKEYQDVLNDNALAPEYRQLVSTTFLPQQRRHISMLDRCLSIVQ